MKIKYFCLLLIIINLFILSSCSQIQDNITTKSVDNIPFINLIGKEEIYILKGSRFNEPGFVAFDIEDGYLTLNVEVINNINTDVEGDYDVIYKVKDYSGKAAIAKKRIVHVISEPDADFDYAKFIANEKIEKAVRITLGKNGTLTENDLNSIKNINVTAENLNDIQLLKNLEEFTFTGTYFLSSSLDIDFSILSTLINFNSLVLERVNNKIISLPENLEILSINKGEFDLNLLKNLNNLKKLNITSQSTTDISALANLPQLKYLRLSRNEIQDISPISNLINLEELYLNANNIENIEALNNLINLEILNIGSNKIANINSLSNLVKLRSLIINFNHIDDISSLEKLINLNYFDCGTNEITNIDVLKTIYDNGGFRKSDSSDDPKIILYHNPLSDTEFELGGTGYFLQDKVTITH